MSLYKANETKDGMGGKCSMYWKLAKWPSIYNTIIEKIHKSSVRYLSPYEKIALK
jgi:hypothetical protein